MNVRFTTFAKRENSTARPGSWTVTRDCQLKNPCTVINPVMIMAASAFNTSYNYAYIPSWDRYYFIDNVNILTGERFEVSLRCDRLASWKDTISNYTAWIERCADSNYYDVKIPDGYLSTNTNIVNNSASRTGFSGMYDSASGCYAIRTVSSGGIETHLCNFTSLYNALSFMFNDGSYGDLFSDGAIKTFFNPFQYIVDIKWLPISYSSITANIPASSTIKYGWWDSGVSAPGLASANIGGRWWADSITIPSNIYSDWRAYSDATSLYSIFIPGVGTVQLSAVDMADGLACSVYMDVISGDTLVKLYSGSLTDGASPTGALLSSYKTNMATSVQIGQLSSGVKGVGQVAQGAIQGFLSGGVIGALGGGIISAANGALQPTASINGQIDGRFVLSQNNQIVVSLTNLGSAAYPENHAGRPCCKALPLGSLSGYIKCGAASVPMNGYADDKEIVDNFLNSGFYME